MLWRYGGVGARAAGRKQKIVGEGDTRAHTGAAVYLLVVVAQHQVVGLVL